MVIHRILGNGVADVTPFAPARKLMPLPAAAVVPAAISAGGTVLGGLLNSIFGSSSNKRTNETNMEIARMNNEQQYKMFQEQNEFNLDMWNKQNEYNDPSAQVQRLLAAGINPSAVFGNGSVAPASQLTSAPAPQLQQARVNPYQPDFKVGEAVNAFQQSMLLNEQRNKLKAETAHIEQITDFDRKSTASRLKSLQEIAKKDDWLGQLAKTQLEYEQGALYWKIQSQKYDVMLQQDQMRLNQKAMYAADLQNGLYEVQLAYAPQLNEAQLKQYYMTVNEIKAQIGLINANTLKTEAERQTEIERKAGMIIDNRMKGFDEKLKKEMKKFVVMDARNHSEMLDFNRRNQKTLTRVGMLSSMVPFASGFKKLDF